MASIQMLARAGVALSQTDLIPKEALSGIFGSISLATWICLMLPQLWLNFQQSSAEALSLPFLFVWMIGDITNLAGAVWAGLVPTVIAIAVYFCFADLLLISQCLYYNNLNANRAERHQSVSSAISEEEPLLSRRRSSENVGLPGSRRRRSSALSGPRRDSLSKIAEEEEVDGKSEWVINTVWILGVIALGTAGWTIAWQTEVWTPQPEHGSVPEANQVAFGASTLGYISAICYLGARLPQIYQNYQTKSVEGLSILFFMLSMMGNTTYGAGILFHSQDPDYLLTNLPWLIGSIGTIVQDCVIFGQFQVYKAKKPTTQAIA